MCKITDPHYEQSNILLDQLQKHFLVIYMGICLEKCHFGFSKFKRVELLILMTFFVYVQ